MTEHEIGSITSRWSVEWSPCSSANVSVLSEMNVDQTQENSLVEFELRLEMTVMYTVIFRHNLQKRNDGLK